MTKSSRRRIAERARQAEQTHKRRKQTIQPQKIGHFAIPSFTDNTARESGPASPHQPPTPQDAGPR